MGGQPFDPGHAVVEPGREGGHLGQGRGRDAVAELHHGHGNALAGDHAPPGLVVAVVARERSHPATVDIVDTRQLLAGGGPYELNACRVAIGCGSEFEILDLEALGRGDFLGVAGIEKGLEHGFDGLGLLAVGGLEHGLAAFDVAAAAEIHRAKYAFDSGVDSRVVRNFAGHDSFPFCWALPFSGR